jgi:hypothetical protein
MSEAREGFVGPEVEVGAPRRQESYQLFVMLKTPVPPLRPS